MSLADVVCCSFEGSADDLVDRIRESSGGLPDTRAPCEVISCDLHESSLNPKTHRVALGRPVEQVRVGSQCLGECATGAGECNHGLEPVVV